MGPVGKIQVFVLFVIYIQSSGAIEDIYDAGNEVWKLYSMIDKMNPAENYEEMKNQMNVIYNQLNETEKIMMPKVIHNMFRSSASNIFLYKCMDTLELFIQSIDDYYLNFHKHINEESYGYRYELKNSVHNVIVNIEEKILMIRKIIIEAEELLPDRKNLIDAIADYAFFVSGRLCGGPYVISSALVQIFRMVMIAEIKAHAITVFASQALLIYNSTWLDSYGREQLEKQFGLYVDLFALHIESTDRLYLRACDPDGGIWIRGKSFHELGGMIQTTIFRYHWTPCKRYSCNVIWNEKYEKCNAKQYDDRSGCSERPSQCAHLNSIQACVLKSGPYKFQWVNSTELGLLGRNTRCPDDNGYIIEDGRGWDYFFSACACNCYGELYKINLSIMETNVKINMVITGLRFILKNKILYLQPREGKLVANGHILQRSERWITLPSTAETSVSFSIVSVLITVCEDRGVKFNKVTRENVTGFAIEIFGVPFVYRSGKLDLSNDLRISRKTSNRNLGEALSFRAVSSLHTNMPHTPSQGSGRYVSLERSELKSDFGQSTLPLFDAVAIKSNPSSAFGGIGIFHKGFEGFAGLISIRVYGIAYAQYFLEFEDRHIRNNKVVFNDSSSG